MKEVGNIKIPCFDCYYGHSCKYYESALWIQWIFQNNQCPAYQYPLESIFYGVLQYKKQQNENRFTWKIGQI